MDIITVNELQKKFDLTIQNNPLRNSKIKNEIEAIEKYVNIFPAQINTFKKQPIKTTIDKTPQIFDLGYTYIYRDIFHDAFHKYLNSEEKTFIEKLHNESEETYYLKQRSANQAIELFEYYKWLNELINPSKKAEKNNSLNHKQIILALYYLGFDMKQFNQTKTGHILGEILGLSPKNTTDYIRHVASGKNDVRTPKNLKIVKQLFEKHGLNEVSDKINPEKPRE